MTAGLAYGMIYFVVANMLVTFVSARLCRLLPIAGRGMPRFLIGIANFVLVVYAVLITTGFLGILNQLGVMLVLLVFFAVVLVVTGRRGEPGVGKITPEQSLGDSDKRYPLIMKLAVVLLSAYSFEWTFRALFFGTYFGPDDVQYHASVITQWLLDGKFTIAPFTYQAYYPFNAELLPLWFMLPFRSDAYASISSFYWGLLSVASLFTLSRAIGISNVSAVFVSGLFIASSGIRGNTLQKILQSFSASDLAGPAALLAALALIVASDRLPVANRRTGNFYSGLLAGYALGSKISYVPAVVLMLLWFFRSPKETSSGSRNKTSGIFPFLLGLVITGSVWYIRNLLLTGNPVFPAEVGPFSGPLSSEAQRRTKLITWILAAPLDAGQWLRIARGLGDWPLHLGFLAFLGYAGTTYSLVSRNSGQKESSARSSYIRLLLICGLCLFGALFFLPFSATTNSPNTGLSAASRYVMFSYAVGLLLFGRLMSRDDRKGRTWRWVAGVSLITLPFLQDIYSLPLLLLGSVLGLLVPTMIHTAIDRRVSNRTLFLAMMAGMIVLALYYPAKKRLTDESLYASARAAAPAFRELEKLPQGSKIGFFNPLPYESTPFHRLYGRQFQMIPVVLDHEGSVPLPLHRVPPKNYKPWWGEFDKLGDRIDGHIFLQNLQRAGVEYLLVTRFPFERWPVQQSVLETMKGVEEIYRDGYSEIWRLKKPAQTGASTQ